MEELGTAGWADSLHAPSLSEGTGPQATMQGSGSGMWSHGWGGYFQWVSHTDISFFQQEKELV